MGKKKPKANGTKPAEKPQGCYVLSLSVENVRCFGPKQTLDCSDGKGRPRQWTVILGDNGTGKTTLLSATAVGTYSSFGNTEDAGRQYARSTQISAEILISLAVGPSIRETRSATVISLKGQIDVRNDRRWEQWDGVEELQASNVGYSDRVFGYGSSRVFITNFSRCSFGTFIDANDSLLSGHPLIDPVQWLLDLDYSAQTVGGSQVVRRNQILDLIRDVLPDVRDVKFIPGSGPVPKPRVEFLTPYGWVPLRQLGHGYQTMIAWVIDFVSRMVERYPDSENPLAEPAVCLVDEIDLHLHPVWQRKVIGYLSERFPNTQFIVTAHSPLVVQAAASADANIAVLERSKEKDADGNYYVEIKNNPEDVKNWRLDQILTSDLFGGLSLNSPKVEELFKEKEHLAGLKRPTPAQKARLIEIEAELTKLPVGDDAREVREMQAIRDALNHLQKRPVK
jgi:hypothetical protein